MFQDALLESSPIMRKRSRWSMAMAFTLEVIVAGALVLLPLITTGVIPLQTHAAVIMPAPYRTPTETVPPHPSPGGSGPTFRNAPTVVVNSPHSIIDRDLQPVGPADNPDPTLPVQTGPGPSGRIANLFPNAQPIPVRPPERRRIVISQPSEAMLLKKVVPEYPRIAQLSGVQGDVKLHAIIAKDGTIQSLTVTSGHPMLITAAKEAVEQWRYRPYMLNGEPVEVETIITVVFKKY